MVHLNWITGKLWLDKLGIFWRSKSIRHSFYGEPENKECIINLMQGQQGHYNQVWHRVWLCGLASSLTRNPYSCYLWLERSISLCVSMSLIYLKYIHATYYIQKSCNTFTNMGNFGHKRTFKITCKVCASLHSWV